MAEHGLVEGGLCHLLRDLEELRKQDTDVYPEAAEALAEKLLNFAETEPGGTVLGPL